jgi:hypothetical protein
LIVASLIIAVITLVVAVFIHSETRDILSRISLIIHTMPGAYDVNRLIRDIERSKQDRAKVVCDAPKNTHLKFTQPAPKISRYRRIKNVFWEYIRKLTGYWSGDIIDESVIQESVIGRWEIKSSPIGSPDLLELLNEGWEPFSVASGNQVWVRKHYNPGGQSNCLTS